MYIKVCEKSQLAADEILRFLPENSEIAIALCNVDGEFHAIADKCSHGNWNLSEGYLENCHLECVLHGSSFDLRTGWPDKMPATKPVKVFDVKVEGEEVFVDIDSGRYRDKAE